MSEAFELHEQLQKHSDLMLQSQDEFRDANRKAVEADLRYKVASATALLAIRADKAFAGFTVDEKKAQVTTICQPEMIEAAIANSDVDVLKMRVKTVDASLSALQSQVKLLLADARMDGYRT